MSEQPLQNPFFQEVREILTQARGKKSYAMRSLLSWTHHHAFGRFCPGKGNSLGTVYRIELEPNPAPSGLNIAALGNLVIPIGTQANLCPIGAQYRSPGQRPGIMIT